MESNEQRVTFDTMAEREYIIPSKEELFLSFEDALTLADEGIDDNWEDYRRKFLEGGII